MNSEQKNLIKRIVDGRTDLVFELISRGIAPDIADDNNIPLIKWVAYYGDVSALKYLLQHGLDLNALGHNYGLHGVVHHGHWRLLQFLIEQGADVNYLLKETNESLLHTSAASTKRSFEMMTKILLHYGAEPNVHTFPNKETGSFMRDSRTKGETALHRAAAFGSVELIQLLLDAGADKEAKDMNGDSPLSWASWHRRKGLVLYKLGFGQHTVRQAHVDKMPNDYAFYREGLMSTNLLGQVHLD